MQRRAVPVLEQLVVGGAGDDPAGEPGMVSSLSTPPSAHGASTSHSAPRIAALSTTWAASSSAARSTRVRVDVGDDQAGAVLCEQRARL